MPRSILLHRYFCTDTSLVEGELKYIPKDVAVYNFYQEYIVY